MYIQLTAVQLSNWSTTSIHVTSNAHFAMNWLFLHPPTCLKYVELETILLTLSRTAALSGLSSVYSVWNIEFETWSSHLSVYRYTNTSMSPPSDKGSVKGRMKPQPTCKQRCILLYDSSYCDSLPELLQREEFICLTCYFHCRQPIQPMLTWKAEYSLSSKMKGTAVLLMRIK